MRLSFRKARTRAENGHRVITAELARNKADEGAYNCAHIRTSMTMPSSPRITGLLQAWGQGDDAALAALTPLVHAELRRLARGYMGRERKDHTLQPTALVNECYLRLIDARQVEWQNRAHFFALSARLMRRILVDFARSRGYKKRGGGARQVTLHESVVVAPEPGPDLVRLDEALTALAALDRRKAHV